MLICIMKIGQLSVAVMSKVTAALCSCFAMAEHFTKRLKVMLVLCCGYMK